MKACSPARAAHVELRAGFRAAARVACSLCCWQQPGAWPYTRSMQCTSYASCHIGNPHGDMSPAQETVTMVPREAAQMACNCDEAPQLLSALRAPPAPRPLAAGRPHLLEAPRAGPGHKPVPEVLVLHLALHGAPRGCPALAG